MKLCTDWSQDSLQSDLFRQTQFDVQRFLRHQELEGGVCYWNQFTVLWTELDLTDAETNWTPAEKVTFTNEYKIDSIIVCACFELKHLNLILDSLFVNLLILVFTTESFHLKLHRTFLSHTHRREQDAFRNITTQSQDQESSPTSISINSKPASEIGSWINSLTANYKSQQDCWKKRHLQEPEC